VGRHAERDEDGHIVAWRTPPRYFRLAYLVTAWRERPKDGHRLLAGVLGYFAGVKGPSPELFNRSIKDLGLPCFVNMGLERMAATPAPAGTPATTSGFPGSGRPALTLPQLLAMIRLGAYDPYLLSKVGDRLHTLLAAATRDVLVDEALRVLEQMVDAAYPLEGSSDVAAAAGQMLHSAGLHRPALEMFAKSRARRGPDPRVLYLEGRCRIALDENDPGIAALRESITLDPAATPAAELLAEVIGDIGVAKEE
jgi:hypothetical protein